jgi:hypothetical protein
VDFVIISIGRTGTQWLSRVLSCHSKIRCFHGPMPFVRIDPLDWDTYFDRVRDIQWDAFGQATGALPAFDGVVAQPIEHFGNIHGFSPSRWLEQRSSYKARYSCVQLTRHPLERLDSMKKRWARREYKVQTGAFEALFEQSVASFESINLPFPPVRGLDDKLFACACALLLPHEARFLASDMPVVKLENLKDMEAIERLTIQLCNARWNSDDADRAAKITPVDAQPGGGLTEGQIKYAGALMRHFGLMSLYERLGYALP